MLKHSIIQGKLCVDSECDVVVVVVVIEMMLLHNVFASHHNFQNSPVFDVYVISFIVYLFSFHLSCLH